MILDDEILDDLQNGLMIIQKKNGFKFGIDAVLLSDFAKDSTSKRTLDLCTGTGIIPLLLSAKTTTPEICGIEIQEEMANVAKRSVEYNKLDERIKITHGDLKDAFSIYGKCCFDKITCNPPYMKINGAVINEKDTLSIARHELMCSLEDVISISAGLLKVKGRFYMIHRPSRLSDIISLMRQYKLEPKKMRFVAPYINKEPNLVLIEAIKCGGAELKMLPTLYVYGENGEYSKEIDRIYGRDVL